MTSFAFTARPTPPEPPLPDRPERPNRPNSSPPERLSDAPPEVRRLAELFRLESPEKPKNPGAPKQ